VGVEVIKKGEKKKLTQCKVHIELTPIVITFPYDEFETSKFLQRLREWLATNVLKKDIIFKYVDQLDYRCLKLQGLIKEYFNFEARENAYAAKW